MASPLDPFVHNEHGVWCPSCGEPLSQEDNEFGSCSVCGYPDDAQAVADFHTGDDE